MIANHLHRKRFSILATFIVAFCLLFAGMRVPDLTRPHRPKPKQRAVIESQVKTSQHIINNSIDFFAIPAKPPELRTALRYSKLSLSLRFTLLQFQLFSPTHHALLLYFCPDNSCFSEINSSAPLCQYTLCCHEWFGVFYIYLSTI